MPAKVMISAEEALPLTPKVFEKIFAEVVKGLKDTEEYAEFTKVMKKPKSVELHFCDDKEMRSYQKRFRKLDRTTDVLSFPSLESPENSEKGFLGSIIISLPTVERNAKRYKSTLRQELINVYVHGILHLFSFDHVKVSRKKKLRMEKYQSDLQKKLKKLL